MKCTTSCYKEIAQYGRLDVKFHQEIKPTVDKFFKTHSVNEQGYIKKLERPTRTSVKLTNKNYVLLYSLIQYYQAFDEMSNGVKDLQKKMKFGVQK